MKLPHRRRLAAPAAGNRPFRQAAAVAMLSVATWTLSSCSATRGIEGSAVAATPVTAPSATTTEGGPALTVFADRAFVGVNYEPDPSFDKYMVNPRLLGAPTVVDGPSGSALTITVYAIDGYEYASRPLVAAPATELRFVTAAWARGRLAQGTSADAGSVAVVRNEIRLADREPLELQPRPASQQDLPTSMYGWIVAVDPTTDTAAVSYTITAMGSGLGGSVRVRDGQPTG